MPNVSQFLRFFSTALTLMIPGTALFMVFVKIKTSKIPDKQAQDKFVKRAMFTYMPVFLVLWCGTSFSHQALNRHLWNQFIGFGKTSYSMMDLEKDGVRHSVTNAAEISRFFSLIQNAAGVSAHHSHPATRIKVFLPGVPQVYSLGLDSANAGEFWLKYEEGPNMQFGEKDETVKQIYSPELDAWLSLYLK